MECESPELPFLHFLKDLKDTFRFRMTLFTRPPELRVPRMSEARRIKMIGISLFFYVRICKKALHLAKRILTINLLTLMASTADISAIAVLLTSLC